MSNLTNQASDKPAQHFQHAQFAEAMNAITEAHKNKVPEAIIRDMVDRFYPQQNEMLSAKAAATIIQATKPAPPTAHQVWSLNLLRLALAIGWVLTFLELLNRGQADIMLVTFLVASSAALGYTFKPRF